MAAHTLSLQFVSPPAPLSSLSVRLSSRLSVWSPRLRSLTDCCALSPPRCLPPSASLGSRATRPSLHTDHLCCVCAGEVFLCVVCLLVRLSVWLIGGRLAAGWLFASASATERPTHRLRRWSPGRAWKHIHWYIDKINEN